MSDITRPKKAIIIAAGMGKRLRPYTDRMPKCMVPVAGKPMLERCMSELRDIGVEEFVIIRGYKADYFDDLDLGPGVSFVDNADYEKNNILHSLFKAESHLTGSFYLSYSDIIYSKNVMKKLHDAPGNFALIVDRDYSLIYEGRTEHPIEQAELCAIGTDGFVSKVGKCSCDPSDAVGAKVSSVGSEALVKGFKASQVAKTSNPFLRAASWEQSYLCDLLEWYAPKLRMTPVYINGEWREIDTVQDKENADRTVNWV